MGDVLLAFWILITAANALVFLCGIWKWIRTGDLLFGLSSGMSALLVLQGVLKITGNT